MVVAVTDIVISYQLMRNPGELTWLFVAVVIFITILPIVLSLWHWLKIKKSTYNHGVKLEDHLRSALDLSRNRMLRVTSSSESQQVIIMPVRKPFFT